jgi:hypothetical protein
LAKALLTSSPSLSKIYDSDRAIEKARENLATDGIGQRSILA